MSRMELYGWGWMVVAAWMFAIRNEVHGAAYLVTGAVFIVGGQILRELRR